LPRLKLPGQLFAAKGAPSFLAALGRLTYAGWTRFKWLEFKPQCPVSPSHPVQDWGEPGKCPRCGVFLEKNAMPYRVWD
jgi:hypothetical protein